MKNHYYNHLVEDVEAHTSELMVFVKTTKDLKKTEKLVALYGNYYKNFSELAQLLSIPHGSEARHEETANSSYPCNDQSLQETVTSHSPADFNVNAPIFVPVTTRSANYSSYGENYNEYSYHHRMDSGDGGHPHMKVWHGPPVLQYSWPHHYHHPTHHHPTHHHPSSVYPGFQGSGVPAPLFSPFQYFEGNVPLQAVPIAEEENSSHRRQYRSQVKSKVRGMHKNRSDCAEYKSEKQVEPVFHTPKSNCEMSSMQETMKSHITLDSSATPKAEVFSEMHFENKLDVVPHSTKETGNPVRVIPSLMDQPVSLPEWLRDFPALSSKMPINKKVKVPRVNFHKKLKFSIGDLLQKYSSSDDANQTTREDKNLSSSYVFRSGKKPRVSAFEEKEKKCPCKSQVILFAHGRTLYEKVPAEVLDEADGWKKVKPRFNKNRDKLKQISIKENLLGVPSCKVCQSTYRRRYESSNQNKHVNIGRNSRVACNRYGSPRNNCTREAISTHVLDLHYKNMLVSPHITHRSSKLNNEVNSPASKSDHVSFVDPKMVSLNTSGIIGERDGNMVSKNHTPVSPYLDSNCIDEFDTENQDLDCGVCDDSIGTSTLLLPPFLDDVFLLQNKFPTLSTNISSSSVVDNEEECSTDCQNNIDPSGELSIDDDNTLNDGIPVIEDAHDMHEEFMKYLNCSTWPTQMDEIDKFESMIAGNNPSDPVLMYPSVSVEQFTEFIQRHPDEAQAFRREITFKLKQIRETESKQQQAYEKRLELLKCKTAKVRGFVQKVKDVQLAQDKLALKRKHQIDEKLRKAEENRKNYLSIIRRKAHDEEEKLKEIAFINELEAQNRRHDSLALRQEQDERRQIIVDERLRRVEEKAAKEAAAEERRRIIESQRQQKLLKIAEARRLKQEEIDRKQQERENQRLEMAREKAREREERLQARDAAQRATAEELQKRIQQKQEDSARRHEENIESIRQRALEVGLHRNVDESINTSPVSKTEEPPILEIEHSPDNPDIIRQKAQRKKRLRKIRIRLNTNGAEYIKNYPFIESEFEKELADVRALAGHPQPSLLVNKLAALRDTVKKHWITENTTFDLFAKSRGFLLLSQILKGCVSPTSRHLNFQDAQSLSIISDVYRMAMLDEAGLSYIVLSNDIMLLVDILKLSVAELESNEKWIKVVDTLLCIITYVLSKRTEGEEVGENANCSLSYICGYVVNVGLVEKIISIFKDVMMDTTHHLTAIIPFCIDFFTSMLNPRYKSSDLMHTLVVTEGFGTIPLLYEGLQKVGSGDDLPTYVTPIVSLLLQFADLDIIMFQDALGGDGMALQIRAIASNLITHARAKGLNSLLQSVILLVGYFAIQNTKNQTLLQSGQQPTVLQQLVTLPFIYFCDQEYTDYLFPTLYVCSFNNFANQAIVENDLSISQLVDYVNSERGQNNLLIKLFHQMEQR